MKTVYLSKSNVCDIDKVIKVRQAIEEADLGLAMYVGGKYDPSLIHRSDYVIMIGPRMSDSYGPNNVVLGKGQLSEAQALINSNTFICINGSASVKTDLMFAHPASVVSVDPDNFQKSGFAIFDSEVFTMDEVIDIIQQGKAPSVDDISPVPLPPFEL